jgi:hypothetical protein
VCASRGTVPRQRPYCACLAMTSQFFYFDGLELKGCTSAILWQSCAPQFGGSSSSRYHSSVSVHAKEGWIGYFFSRVRETCTLSLSPHIPFHPFLANFAPISQFEPIFEHMFYTCDRDGRKVKARHGKTRMIGDLICGPVPNESQVTWSVPRDFNHRILTPSTKAPLRLPQTSLLSRASRGLIALHASLDTSLLGWRMICAGTHGNLDILRQTGLVL